MQPCDPVGFDSIEAALSLRDERCRAEGAACEEGMSGGGLRSGGGRGRRRNIRRRGARERRRKGSKGDRSRVHSGGSSSRQRVGGGSICGFNTADGVYNLRVPIRRFSRGIVLLFAFHIAVRLRLALLFLPLHLFSRFVRAVQLPIDEERRSRGRRPEWRMEGNTRDDGARRR